MSRAKTDHRRTIRTSHWRAGVRLLLSAIGILVGVGFTQDPGSPGVSPHYWDVVGLLTIAGFSILSVLYAPALVVPDRLIIEDDGFILRTFWRGDRHFPWVHIKSVRADWRAVSQPYYFVWWYYREGSPYRTASRARTRDTLPSSLLWTVPPTQIAEAMELARRRYRRRIKAEVPRTSR